MGLTIKTAKPAPLLMTTAQAADFISMSESFLAQDRWRSNATGCPPVFPFVRVGRAVRYRQTDLVAALDARLIAKGEG